MSDNRNSLVQQLFLDGKITEEEKDKYNKFGAASVSKMLKEGAAKEVDVISAYSKVTGMEYAEDVQKLTLDLHLSDLVQENIARAHTIVPIEYDTNSKVLTVALSLQSVSKKVDMADSIKKSAPAAITRIKWVITEITQISNQIEKLYRGDRKISALLDKRKTALENTSKIDKPTTIIDATEDSEAQRFVNLVLQQAIEDGASDIHFEPGDKEGIVRFRIDGVLHIFKKIPRDMIPGVTNSVKILSNIDIAEKRRPQDGSLTIRHEKRGKIDFRVATMPVETGGEKEVNDEQIVMRLLDNSQASVELSSLGFSEENLIKYEKAYNAPYGMVLVTGPTGSGKSTTLYATLNKIVSTEKKIITVENPVEYKIDGINQVQTNDKAGMTFAGALRAILRSDPDIILVGEVRDKETAMMAVEAGLTGHLILTTLHTNDAPQAIVRLVEMGVDAFLVGNVVNGILAQRLLRKLCQECKKKAPVDEEYMKRIKIPEYIIEKVKESGGFYEAIGCHACTAGYKGRISVNEILLKDDEIERLIMREATPQEIKDYAVKEQGMKTMREDALLKAIDGITSLEEVIRVIKET